jgi:RNA polymerase II C-terminal domain phosphatase-like 1/2
VEEDIGKAESNYRPSAIAQELDSLKSDKLQGCWLVEEDIGKAESNYRPSAIAQELDSLKSDKLRGTQNPFAHGASAYASSGFVSPASESKDEEVV